MAKAKPTQEAKPLTFQERKEAIEKEIQAILDKYKAQFDIHIIWNPKGAIPRLVLVDLEQKSEDVKESTTN